MSPESRRYSHPRGHRYLTREDRPLAAHPALLYVLDENGKRAELTGKTPAAGAPVAASAA
ncbi:hypothetical protein D9753_15665 [Streptomyces dangxiongensis]|uniref:Uncharacterized protein n=1 Tax=Streptomyces dangxiongensis TaxID=1442032 RepID=A0A3G2JCQ4_9ACTN|nr:hypothetical protein D9753_15665 [Streptomyces dangxiongensis]